MGSFYWWYYYDVVEIVYWLFDEVFFLLCFLVFGGVGE